MEHDVSITTSVSCGCRDELSIGLTASRLLQVFSIIATHNGKSQADIARNVLLKRADKSPTMPGKLKISLHTRHKIFISSIVRGR
jgi:hypothetical protein